MNSNAIPGRQLHRICGRAVVHSDKMDLAFVTPDLQQTAPLFMEPKAGGRFTIECDGFLSALDSAALNVVIVGEEYTSFFCDVQYAQELLAIQSVERLAGLYYPVIFAGVLELSPPSPEQNALGHLYEAFKITLTNGTEYLYGHTNTFVDAQAVNFAYDGTQSVDEWYTSYYLPKMNSFDQSKLVPGLGLVDVESFGLVRVAAPCLVYPSTVLQPAP